MLTRAGLLVGATAAGLLVGGRVFGLVELYICGAAAGILLAICFGWVVLSRLDLGAGRKITPLRVHAGTPARSTIRIRNLRASRTPVLRLLDPVTGTSGADLLVNPLRGGESATIAYRLPSDRRGVVEVGPLDVVVTDPFGLTSVRTRAAGTASLTVFPRVDQIEPPRQAAGPDPTSGAAHPSALGRSGDEFHALRPYVIGDDLRRVHWASTARTGDLVVRQDELPWQGRTTVLLDQRHGSFVPQVFEQAVSAAASIINAAWRRGDLVRLVATDGNETDLGSGHAHLESIFERLSLVSRSNRSDPATTARTIGRSGSNGALVVVSGALRGSEQLGVKRAAVGFGRLTFVMFGTSGTPSALPGASMLSIPTGTSFRSVWQGSHASSRSRARVGPR